MNLINAVALILVMAAIGGMVWALIDSHSICRKTISLVEEYDRAWGTDKENAA